MKLITLLLMLFLPVTSQADPEVTEEGDEFIKIQVQYRNNDVGLIWAYKCETCLPRRFMFDGRLVVETDQGKVGPQGLRAIDGRSAVITWIPNTLQALRVWPIQ